MRLARLRLPARGLGWYAAREAAATQAGDRLRACGRAFAVGFNAYGLRGDRSALSALLTGLPPDQRGLAVEGAAMAAGLSPAAPDRLQRLLDGPGAEHPYTAHVGAGWAATFLGRALPRGWDGMHPLLRWLSVDGSGFCAAFFQRRRTRAGASPARRRRDQQRVRDQGIGRALWFVTGASVIGAADAIERCAPHRRGDLWSGLALAAVYAGGVPPGHAARLPRTAGQWRGDVAQGAAFAAQARLVGGAADEEADARVRALTGCDLPTAAASTDAALAATAGDGSLDDYLAWRAATRAALDGPPAPHTAGSGQ